MIDFLTRKIWQNFSGLLFWIYWKLELIVFSCPLFVSYAKQNCGLTCSTGNILSASSTHEISSYKNNFTSTSPVDVTADDCSVECRSESRDRFIHHNFVQFGKQHSRYKATGRPLFVTAVLWSILRPSYNSEPVWGLDYQRSLKSSP